MREHIVVSQHVWFSPNSSSWSIINAPFEIATLGGQTMSRCSENPKYHVDYPIFFWFFLIDICLVVVSSFRIATRANPQRFRSPLCLQGNPITRTTWTFWSGPCCCAHLGAPRETARDGNGWMGLDGLEAHVFWCFIQFDCHFSKWFSTLGLENLSKLMREAKRNTKQFWGNHQERLRRSATGSCQPIWGFMGPSQCP